ncbi:Peptidoglycan hydrolase FlgJ [Burkholderia sp. AD24]|nr:Peptidoglycan hydrolase FlgJ [Burkholderia sp. AD24]
MTDEKKYTYQDKLQFIQNLYCAARQVAAESGCSWELLLAQTAEETGWGEKVLPGTNNIYNVKADASWTGESRIFNVWEKDRAGQTYWVKAPFRVYPSVLESMRDRQKFVESNHRYAAAGLFNDGIKGDPDKELAVIATAGYASDGDYVKKVKGVMYGPTMKRAVTAAQKVGCKGCLPTVNVYVLDQARAPLANTKIKATQGSQTVELMTDRNGQVQVQAALSGGPVSLQAWSEHDHTWVPIEQSVTPTTPATAITVVAPTIVVPSATELHQPPPAHAGASHPSEPASTDAPTPAPTHDMHSARTSSHAGTQTYVVQKGDTLGKIAKKHSANYRTLAHLNGIASPYFLYPQQVLVVPKPHVSGASRAAAMPGAAAVATSATAPTSASGSQASRSVPTTLGASGSAPSAHANPNSGSASAAPPAMHVSAPAPTPTVHAIRSRDAGDHPTTEALSTHHAPWMAVADSEYQLGIKRGGGVVSTEHIRDYFGATSDVHANPNRDAYCAAFVNWCLKRAGYDGNNDAWSANLARWGKSTRGNKPAYGAVAVIRFPTGGHHVTFVNGKAPPAHGQPRIATLGGNQGTGHAVTYSSLPESWVVAYRFPSDYTESDDDYDLKLMEHGGPQMSEASTR